MKVKHLEDECQHLEDECSHLEDEYYNVEDEYMYLGDECQHLQVVPYTFERCMDLEDEQSTWNMNTNTWKMNPLYKE